MHSIRKFVGRGTLALGIGASVALAVAVQSGQAARPNDAMQVEALAPVTQTSIHLNFTATSPSPACTSAIGQIQAAVAKDVTEDLSERSANTTDTETGADQAEDTSERAALKPLIAAVVAACGTTREGDKAPPVVINKSPACTAALQALKAALAADRATAEAEFTNGTEGTAADQSQDQAAFAQLQSLWAAVKAACSTGTSGTSTFSWWEHR